ncbi:hypothetical protein ACFE04_019957 [Oxalis oulophora]
MGPISASFGDNGVFCAIDASGKQNVICWGKNTSSLSITPSTSSSSAMAAAYFTNIPALAGLAGGENFLCGILANTSQALCWSSADSTTDLLPSAYKSTAYSHIAAGMNHVCAIRGTYYSDHDLGTVDCWDVLEIQNNNNNNGFVSRETSVFYYDQGIVNLVFRRLTSGQGFSCGIVRQGSIVCWGPNATQLGVSNLTESFEIIASGRNSLCAISNLSSEVKCWGEINNASYAHPPNGTQFVALTAGARHFCGIRKDNHQVECWGSFNLSSVPKTAGFLAIASSDFTTCGIREDDLVLDCWSAINSSLPNYDPPLELCSPGLCMSGYCHENQFAYNASNLNEADLTNLCVRKDLKICSPCGSNCSEGFFLSSPCTENSDRVCTACSLCQNSTCWDICGLHSTSEKTWHRLRKLVLIIGCSASGFLFVFVSCCLLPCLCGKQKGKGLKKQNNFCIGKSDLENDIHLELQPTQSSVSCPPGVAQIFRLSELKDATNGFKEFNELGRGNYGFVYKAVLADGQQVAVKRANAATIIHTNSRDFEIELETLCNVRHCNIVNLLGYCLEMGERLLVYEYMPHGTLHDHLHGGLSSLSWNHRLKIVMQAAKGLECLHKEVVPPIIHRDVKSSNILLDSDWGARIADFGLVTSKEQESGNVKDDVYDFGIVLLEILSGRKAYDRDCTPPNIIERTVPLIKQGKAAAIIDRLVSLPRNFEPLFKLADIAELAVREDLNQRPTMSEIASWLEQIVKEGLIM